MAKKRVYKLQIDHLRYPDKGIAFLDDGEGSLKEVHVKHGLPGQLVEAECSNKKKQLVGRILQVLEHAPEETSPICPDFSICGGCSFLNIPYEYELELKKKMVAELLKDVWKEEIPSIIPAPNCAGYRNKMEFSFGDSDAYGLGGKLALGIRKRNRYYEVAVPVDCTLVPKDFKTLAVATLEYFKQTNETFYHRMRHIGNLRYLILRRGEFTGELLINLVTTSGLDQSHVEKWAAELLSLPLNNMPEGEIVGILHTVSDSVADAVVPENVRVLWGRDYFYEKICGLTFRISTFSFFQTYSAGAELLYDTVAEFVGKADKVYDLYCGTGTIAQVLATHKNVMAKEILGMELVPEAVEAAKENAHINGITNCQFIAGDVLKLLTSTPNSNPDVLVLDPPRDGIHPKALHNLIDLGASKIVYISCKPTSLARDLASFMESGYKLTKIRLHDMFPRTPHVETVCLLEKVCN
ncbi:MAG: 23S rRNA (uracil(1939)-C(5))-methyltransferase RlmD [Defluviitaleaceae bacterium]|nr:23S rRNA (uracil(1939)-C(5))-methyltransferase RlmD [Defluviitaleaceae bacterium]